jgi:hypothetical protein
MNGLTPRDRRRYEELKKQMSAGMWQVAEAAAEIRDNKLYLDEYTSFSEFIAVEMNYSEKHIYNLINASKGRKVIENVKTSCTPVQEEYTLSTAAEIGKLPIEEAQKVVEKVTSAGLPMTAANVRKVKADLLAPLPDATVTEWEDVPDEPEPEPKPEPKPDPVQTKAEQARAFKSIIKQHNDAMMRTIDDLQRAWPNGKLHARALGAFEAIHEVMEEWMKVKK